TMQELILFSVGIVVGGMNAIAGGGMLIGFPVLLWAGLPPIVANATGHITVLPGALSSVFGYRKFLRKVPKFYLLLAIPCAIGAAMGALILRQTSFDNFQQLVPWLILFAVVLFAFQPLLHLHLHRHIHTHRKKRSRYALLIISLAILPMAVYGGYFGAGFGFIMLAFLGFTSLHDVHKMNAIKSLAVTIITLVSIICLLGSGLIEWKAGLTMAAGNLIGGYYGAVLAQKVSTHTVRMVVVAIGLSTAAYLALQQY
ncbi:MAG TPA: sulfite exporter TauE/SafE family protein, partial [Candidatus Limnocylindrales bacterium]|nr:sulfite exporter TauE/SafE family protein [Candidatus Limnocylindrales bacterium]